MDRRALMLTAVAAGAAPAAASAAQTKAPPAVLKFYEVLNTRNAALLPQVMLEEWSEDALAPGQKPGRAGFAEQLGKLGQMIPDLKIAMQDVIVGGNKVVVRGLITGTHSTPLFSFAPTNKGFSIMTIDIHELAPSGLLKFTWHLEDWLGAMFQVGALPK